MIEPNNEVLSEEGKPEMPLQTRDQPDDDSFDKLRGPSAATEPTEDISLTEHKKRAAREKKPPKKNKERNRRRSRRSSHRSSQSNTRLARAKREDNQV